MVSFFRSCHDVLNVLLSCYLRNLLGTDSSPKGEKVNYEPNIQKSLPQLARFDLFEFNFKVCKLSEVHLKQSNIIFRPDKFSCVDVGKLPSVLLFFQIRPKVHY